ncbi:glycoside hydrolase family 3 protein [bacterium]|nr:glycoside hydrolase family 3 protein [bacterium]
MDIKDKLYSMFILGTQGGGYEKLLTHPLGGLIFFTHDIQSKEQFKNLIKNIKNKAKYPLFFSIDQEGGRVERTENIHCGKKYLSAKFAYEKGEDFLKKQTEEIAIELKDFGINLNFAPCIDTNTNPNNPIIGERAFSNNTEDVINAEKIVSKTYLENGVIPCAKHFPGHGDANADSHLSLPRIDLPFDEMEKFHIAPFKSSIKNNIPMIMVAHLHCTCFDKEIIPTSLSKNAISYLRNNLNFDGVIISDDMIMKGVSAFGATEACLMGIKAGLNMFIYRDSTPETISIIDNLANLAETDTKLYANIETSYEKITTLKNKFV